ncbi:NAD(P)-dependent oxidoreductase [Burkholderiales bacterium]|nr:NAD(P)-dependent oxidoreductase [Burkholderiales bacterium]
MRLVVTGSSGFLGRALVVEASSRQWEVVAVSRRALTPPPGVEFHQVADYMDTPPGDCIVHLAEASDMFSPRDQISEVMDQESLIESLVQKSLRGVVYASSSAVYGRSATVPFVESAPILGNNDYVINKIKNEKTTLDCGGIVLRFSNIFGPRMSESNVISDIFKQMSSSGPVVLKSLSPIRDFLWVEDAVKAVCDIVEIEDRGIFNVGSGIGTSIGTLAKKCLTFAGQERREVLGVLDDREQNCNVVSVRKLSKYCCWKPLIGLDEGLQLLLRKFNTD